MRRAGKIQFLKDVQAGTVKYHLNIDAMTGDELLFLSNLDDRLEEGGQITSDETERLQAIETRVGLMVSEHYSNL